MLFELFGASDALTFLTRNDFSARQAKKGLGRSLPDTSAVLNRFLDRLSSVDLNLVVKTKDGRLRFSQADLAKIPSVSCLLGAQTLCRDYGICKHYASVDGQLLDSSISSLKSASCFRRCYCCSAMGLRSA